VLARGYGRVGPRTDGPPTLDTVYDIGSMPIDFTRAAILFLCQTGRASLDDPIGRHIAGVPADKAGITLGQLMEGRSGLANFHFRDTDADKDLAWIDRDTALKRIFEQPLLFAPGTGSSHSHSAFGLLAAVVENVSGQAYGDFLRETLFGPAGMKRTGFYGESLGLPDSAFAVGSGQAASTPSIPPRWGPASWLVIGSGGMVSSVGDMRRGFEYIASGRLLRGPWLQRYLVARVGIGGSDRGYLFLRVTADDGSAVYLASHSHRQAGDDGRLVQGLIGLVLPDRDSGPRPAN
jgi:CubicO group peptidase (beta-lactamase class C family)